MTAQQATPPAGHGHGGVHHPFITYYRHGEIVLLMRPNPELDREALPLTSENLDGLRKQLDGLDDITRRENRDPFYANPFQSMCGPRGLMPVTRKARRDGDEIVDDTVILQGLNLASWIPNPELLDPRNNPDHRKAGRAAIHDVSAVVSALNDVIRRDGNAALKVGDFLCEAVSPNWLASAMDSACSGCPGGRPVPPEEPDPDPKKGKPGKPPEFDPAKPHTFKQPDVLAVVNECAKHLECEVVGETQQGAGVMVAVFDTWPMSQDPLLSSSHLGVIASASVATPDNPRLKLAATGAMVPAGSIWDYATSSGLGNTDAHPTNPDGSFEEAYPIPDHGLFVVDIIDQIAPCAEISVYRVLTDMGNIDLLTLNRAMQHAINRAAAAKKKLVMNLSLGFGPQVLMMEDFFRAGTPAKVYLESDGWGKHQRSKQPKEQKADRNRPMEIREREADLLRSRLELKVINHLFSFAYDPNVLLVAAAGNDSDRDGRGTKQKDRHVWGPRTPAAIEGVVGVSSVKDFQGTRGTPSSYTNADDILVPLRDGVCAYSGDATDHGVQSVTTDGLLGLYISDQFPGPTNAPNRYKLARWTGTSFATPIISGVAASLWSTYPNLTAARLVDAICAQRVIKLEQKK